MAMSARAILRWISPRAVTFKTAGRFRAGVLTLLAFLSPKWREGLYSDVSDPVTFCHATREAISSIKGCRPGRCFRLYLVLAGNGP